MIFLDEIEAEMEGEAFLCGLTDKNAPSELRIDNHEHDGKTLSVWQRGKLLGIAVILRDDGNASVLVTTKV